MTGPESDERLTCTSEAELVHYFAREIRDIHASGTVGDYTWSGLLWSFAGAMEIVRAKGSVTFVPLRDALMDLTKEPEQPEEQPEDEEQPQ